jgi:2-dehydropantoate 2-reductase
MGAQTAILPLLNGLSHLEHLEEAFGPDRVLGGAAYISATLAPDGIVRQLTAHNRIVFGELDGSESERVRKLKAAFGSAPVQVEAAHNIRAQMWEKLVGLGTLAAVTVLMRANVGEVARAPGGVPWMHRLLDRSAAAAAAAGHPVRPEVLEGFMRPTLEDVHSVLAASMLRDLEAGRRIEADHILGVLLEAIRRADIPDELHEAAYLQAKAYENRRDAGRLPMR